MLSEIQAMPQVARAFLANTADFHLPLRVPYLGMGSSYFAPLAFKCMGIDIRPEIASEYYNYLSRGVKEPLAVLLSQSGKSSEVLWCSELFETYIAITNNTQSPLSTSHSAVEVIALQSGEEKFSSSKTYLNTLLALFRGFGLEVGKAVDTLSRNIGEYDALGKHLADKVYELIQENRLNGLYVTGSGANIATALQAALILSESTKLNFNGLAMSQYDHGPKETAKNSVVIQVAAKGKSYDRTIRLGATIKAAGGHAFIVEEPAVTENESILNNIIPFNYMAYHLSQRLQVQDTFVVGGKVTEVH